jgi:hypothetical protein
LWDGKIDSRDETDRIKSQSKNYNEMNRIQYKWDRLCKHNIEWESLREEDNLLNIDWFSNEIQNFLKYNHKG